MIDINTLRNKYFVQSTDTNPPAEPMPATYRDCKITPLIDCARYNEEIEAALKKVGTGPSEASNTDHFILISNWWLGLSGGEYQAASILPSFSGPQVVRTEHYRLDGPGGSKELIDILVEKARAGVDVRVLGWVSFAIMENAIAQKSGAGHIASVNALTMKSIKDLRAEPKIGSKAVLNVISHTAGGVHTKFVLIGTNKEAVGFTGGLDFEMQRWAHPGHSGLESWHDVVAKVEGPVVQALYDFFQKMWHENISRPARRFKFEGEEITSFLPGTPVLNARSLPVPTSPTGKHHAQSLRTIPAFKYKRYNCMPENRPIAFAPQGLFEFKVAIRKALTNAETYIYIEDQSFWSKEILEWANSAIRARSGLRVIFLTSGGADPNDPDFPDAILCNSINHGLLEGLNSSQRDQVRMYKRMGDYRVILHIEITAVADDGSTSRLTTNLKAPERLAQNSLARKRFLIVMGRDDFRVVGNQPAAKDELIVLVVENRPGPTVPVTGTYKLYEQIGITIHSKTTLIDDEFAIIGSANIMRRSLYTDLEHSIGILDEDGLLIKNYRKALWADHFRHADPDNFDSIQESLHAWESSWGVAGAAPSRPDLLEPIRLPISPDEPLQGSTKSEYDMYTDLDSREEWGGILP